MKVFCPYCDRQAELINGGRMYPHLPHLQAKWFYRCVPCGAHVGCHEAERPGRRGVGDGTTPLGTLANPALRRARSRVHELLDPMWMSARYKHAQRQFTYAWLASKLGISTHNCHVAMFDMDACNRAIAAIATRKVPA